MTMLSIVIPAYNESESIQSSIARIAEIKAGNNCSMITMVFIRCTSLENKPPTRRRPQLPGVGESNPGPFLSALPAGNPTLADVVATSTTLKTA